MTAWIAPFELAAVLLALGGVLKALHPSDTAHALRAAGVPVPRSMVRAAGGAEAAIACVAFLSGFPVAIALVAASYGVFAGFIWIAQRRQLPISSCGCFGRVDTPPSAIHLALTIAAALVAVGALAHGAEGFADVLAAQPLGGVPYVFLLVLGTWLAYLALTSLPRLVTLRSREAGE
jgi:hypothetical protein